MKNKYLKIKYTFKTIVVAFICLITLISCNTSDKNIDISQRFYIINLNSNIVHRTTCQTVPMMSEKNKIISDKRIEEILEDGYFACKDCKPDRDALYIINKDINKFERILHDEFGFGEDYKDKILRCLSNLYEGINARKKNVYNSTVEYHKILASCVYQNKKTWGRIAGLYDSEDTVKKHLKDNFNSLRINDKSYFDDVSVNNLYDAVKEEHNILSGNDNDFAHMSATISVYNTKSLIKIVAGKIAQEYNGINDIEVQCGFIGDICGVNGTKPSMNKDDYAADLDAVNLFNRYSKKADSSIYEIFIEYYSGIKSNKINRAEEFLSNISISTINKYREIYINHLRYNDNFKFDVKDHEYTNRLNYFDNFVKHLTNHDQNFIQCKYFYYDEY